MWRERSASWPRTERRRLPGTRRVAWRPGGPMSESIKMPQLGESVAEGTMGKWLKRPGDRVERDEPLVEVMTDKVNADIPSSAAGILERILAPEGTVVAVNQEIAIIGDGSNVVGLDEELGAEAGAATPSALESPAA